MVADADELTARQAEVLRAIARHYREHGVPPTVREVCEAMGFSSPNALSCHLEALARKGAIVWRQDGRSRGIVLAACEEAAKKAAAELLKGAK
jgi:repressor LexA